MTTTAAADPSTSQSPAFSGLVEELRRYLRVHRVEVEAMIREGGERSGRVASQRLTKVYDGMISFLLSAVEGVATREQRWAATSIAAVGSYGRGGLGYHSDLDIRLLCAGTTETAQGIAETLLYPMWDAGLAVGHQVVDVKEMGDLVHEDLPTATSMLDWRRVGGETGLARPMLDRVFDGMFGVGTVGAFLERLAAQVDERHARFGGSVYLLEPDVKNGAGGLRDLDVIFWILRSRWRAHELRDLVRVAVLVPRESEQIAAAGELLWRIRNLLHLHGGRRTDRLSFERQEQLAEALGYGDGGAAVERFMSDYYRAARTLNRARDMLMYRAMPRPVRRPRETLIGNGLKLTSGAVSLSHPAGLRTTPALALRLYDEAVRRDVPVYGFARDVVARATSSSEFCERLRESSEAADLFVRLCMVSRRTSLKHGSVLKELDDVGLLLAMVPEFAPVVGRVHHDIYHTYTVDVHSVAAVDRLAALCRGEYAEEHALASRLAAEIARPTVLFLATLLHDIGKDRGGQHHSVRGAELAETILERLRLPAADIAEIQHLIRKHLRMYLVATCRDIDDPRTLESFCAEVHGQEGLRELYLLTVCDVSTTSPGALSTWKARMLDELYVAADRHLSEGAEARKRLGTETVRVQVHEAWDSDADRPFLDQFLASMPERYLHANSPAGVVAHARLVRDVRDEQVGVRLLAHHQSYCELAVVADDRPGLLALIAAALAGEVGGGAAGRRAGGGARGGARRRPTGGGRSPDLLLRHRARPGAGAGRVLGPGPGGSGGHGASL